MTVWRAMEYFYTGRFHPDDEGYALARPGHPPPKDYSPASSAKPIPEIPRSGLYYVLDVLSHAIMQNFVGLMEEAHRLFPAMLRTATTDAILELLQMLQSRRLGTHLGVMCFKDELINEYLQRTIGSCGPKSDLTELDMIAENPELASLLLGSALKHLWKYKQAINTMANFNFDLNINAESRSRQMSFTDRLALMKRSKAFFPTCPCGKDAVDFDHSNVNFQCSNHKKTAGRG